MRRVVPIILLCVLLPLHVVSLRSTTTAWQALPQGEATAYAIPGPILKITALEFDGLASDFMFLRALVFYGSTFERTEKPRVKEWEWRRLHHELTAATDLDPYFLDPYYLAQAMTWEGSVVKETNILLAKGSQYRDWDWMLPFFAGFNHFYFLQENDQASVYLMKASRRPDATPVFASLATRLAKKGNRTENAIVFLQEMLKREEDEEIKMGYLLRLEALNGILALEKAVAAHKTQFGRPPATLTELVEQRLLEQIPVDPYGGQFYLDAEGSIKTTSELRDWLKNQEPPALF